MKRCLSLLVLLAACGGSAAPRAVADPARGLRNLSADSADVEVIAIAAMRSLPPMNPQPGFAGVFVNARRSREASDAVGRATGFPVINPTTARAATAQCRAVSSSGESRPIPCPASALASMPPVLTIEEIRSVRDTAYVGVSEKTTTSEKATCITLYGKAGNWAVLRSMIVADAKHCGR